MRTKEISKWIDEGEPLPQDLTQEEKEHLMKLGWTTMVMEYLNGQKEFERHYLHGKKHGKHEWWLSSGQKDCERHYFHGMEHGVFKSWNDDGNLITDEEYFYGNRIK